MIKKLRLVNFRNFEERIFNFDGKKIFITGNNGKGKTNILEALSLISGKSVIGVDFDNLLQVGKDYFFVEVNEKFSISYEKENNKKKYLINKTSKTRKSFREESYLSVIFSPIIINMMYLSPSLRRDFLDGIILTSYPEYSQLLKLYKKCLNNRNKILKNISEGKSDKVELNYWDETFVKLCVKIYEYRFKLINYLIIETKNLKHIFGDKIINIDFIYNSKVSENSIKFDIENYLKNNRDRDIILKRTHIGPHIDDFSIIADDHNVTDFGSRGEVKSIVLGLKLMEISFIEKITNKKPVLIIDDLLSELDEQHKDILLNKIEKYQTFITSIEVKNEDNITLL